MIGFDFTTAGRIIFGVGTISEIKRLVGEQSRVLLVQGPESANAARVEELLLSLRCKVQNFIVAEEPTVVLIRQGIELARGIAIDWVVAVGGGSVIDAGKAIAGMTTNAGDILDYLEVVGKGATLKNPSLPMIAAPTTAGTGSEVTRNAVINVTEKKFKASLRSPFLLPKAAIVDPELGLTMPPAVTASTGMDALAQVLEPFVSTRANALTDIFCREGLRLAARSVVKAFRNGSDLTARSEMAYTSLLGGLALANAGLGAVHGFASPIGGMYAAPHGAVCARLLPGVVRANVAALRQREPENPVLEKFNIIAEVLTQSPSASIKDGIRWLQDLLTILEIRPLKAYGITEGDIPSIAEKAAAASSMKANPIILNQAELEKILTEAL
ncbi:MAG TPA: iron-containing alcohol dehydrogenase [Anaerolineaceae bacterium]|nr:iron-containing alcohol dehydrogenase [Anaerolineaceae bacterium]